MPIEPSRHPGLAGDGPVFAFSSQVGFDELDFFGMLHNTRFPLHMERAIIGFYLEKGLARRGNHDLHQFLRETRVTYLTPRTTYGVMRVEAWVTAMGDSSCTYEVLCCSDDSDHVYARGSRSVVKVDLATRKAMSWTGEFRDAHRPLVRPRPE